MYINEGKIAWVDLTTKKVTYEPSIKYKAYIGGRCLGSYLVYRGVPIACHPLDSENIIVFSTGPLTGTLAPCSGRLNISFKNVASGGISFANAGGHFAPEMKYAGIDHLVIKGKSREPVYLMIADNQVTIHSATDLWGLDSWETEDLLRKKLCDPKIHIATIGQAGENLVTMACIMVDKSRAAGWGGCGAVMGSKKLKAVVARGTQAIVPYSPDNFINCCKEKWQKLYDSQMVRLVQKYGLLGTSGAGGIDGTVPQSVRNMEDEIWDPVKTQKVKEIVFKEKYETRRLANFSCPVYCSHFYHVKEGIFKDLKLEDLKTNVYRAFGSNFDLDDRQYILKANEIANRYGMNCDSLSAVIAWAIEVFQKKLIDPQITEGLILKWGDGPGILDLFHRIAFRNNNWGDLLAKGVYQASSAIGNGTEKYAMHAKKVGMCEQGMRSFKGWALGIMVSTRGGSHLAGAPNTEQKRLSKEESLSLFNIPTAGDPLVYEGKGKLVSWFEKYKIIADTLGICTSASYWFDTNLLGPEDFSELLFWATGWHVSGEDLLKLGERVYNIEKGFNTLHASFSRKDDMPPYKLTHIPVSGGPFKGEKIEVGKWNTMLDEYYESHGWDRESGWQTEEKLLELGLPELAKELRKAGRLKKKSGTANGCLQ